MRRLDALRFLQDSREYAQSASQNPEIVITAAEDDSAHFGYLQAASLRTVFQCDVLE